MYGFAMFCFGALFGCSSLTVAAVIYVDHLNRKDGKK